MRIDRLTGFGVLVLGLGAASSAILGPLVLGVIEFRVSESAENQLIGGEIISLFAVAPLAVLAGVLWLRGYQLAPVLAIGPALYAVYLYVQVVVGPEYLRYNGNNEDFFPLFLALVILGWVIALRAWAALTDISLPPPPSSLRRGLASILIILGTIFALAWTGSIVDVLTGGRASQAYQDDPTLFWLIRLMDLAFIIPAALITGIGLLRRAVWATRLGYATGSFLTLEVGAVAGMSVAMNVREDPAADPVLLTVTVVSTLALVAVVGGWLRHSARATLAPPCEERAEFPT